VAIVRDARAAGDPISCRVITNGEDSSPELDRQWWVEYRLDPRQPTIQRLQALAPGLEEAWVFQSPGDFPNESDLRVTMTQFADSQMSWTEDGWGAEAGQWQLQPDRLYAQQLGAIRSDGE